jgi:retinol dehydrogenase 12
VKGKKVIVTGATAGIGKVTALELARLGAAVTLVSRSAEKCKAVATGIRAATGADVDFVQADLSNAAEVRAAADVLLDKHAHIDVLVNNAGAIFDQRQESADGIEMTWALNHLSYFHLTGLLLPALKAAPAARVVNVSSGAHMISQRGINFEDVQFKTRYNGWGAYGQSKLANILFSNELARRTGLRSNALHPGAVGTSFGRNNAGLFWRLFVKFTDKFTLSPEDGAKTSIYLASSAEVEGMRGLYFDRCKPARTSAAARDTAAAAHLWSMSVEMTGLGHLA